MKFNTMILKNELEFRYFILNNIDNITNLYVYEDKLDNVIYFYCILSNNIIIAAKELSNNNYISYQNIYKNIVNMQIKKCDIHTLKLSK